MMYNYESKIAAVNQINIHYLDFKNEHPPLLLLHGLTANAFAFNGLIQAGLADHFRVISIDFRGRGLSSKVAFHYSIREHAADVMGLLDHLGIDKIHVCGHSFGGLMASYLAYHFPDRFERIVILDAAPQMNPKAAEMLGPALSRIDTRFASFETYLETIRQAPYLHFWDTAMEAYYRADVATAADGSVEPISNLSDIIQIATHVSKEPWDTYFTSITHEVLLVVALDEYTMEMPLLPDQKAREIVSRMHHATLHEMHGNHQTMLFGDHARELVEMICEHL